MSLTSLVHPARISQIQAKIGVIQDTYSKRSPIPDGTKPKTCRFLTKSATSW